VLGVTLLTGNGAVLVFGGQVMKNVAGYDVSRLMVGALGTLGVILDVSFKVLPRPTSEQTLCLPGNEFRKQTEGVSLTALGLSATARLGANIYIRVGEDSGLQGDVVSNTFWDQIANHQLPELQEGEELWRISVPTSSQQFEDAVVTEWAGALRWVVDPEDHPHRVLQAGHATLFRTSNDSERVRFHPLDPVLSCIHENLKKHFDPHGIFNPNRLTWHANQNTS
ncbi:MAG: glycolate oxidase subunit GlcE, partial [Pseudomonadales bacterium]|nr:glycolate oxidase subunit GlcE [Pseudomonadales bacterium]